MGKITKAQRYTECFIMTMWWELYTLQRTGWAFQRAGGPGRTLSEDYASRLFGSYEPFLRGLVIE